MPPVNRVEGLRRLGRSRGLLLVAAGAAAYAWIAAALRPFTQPENGLVALPMIVGVVLAARPVRSEPLETAATAGAWRRSALLWLAVTLALVAWELLALFSSPRDDHPTLSYFADRIMSVHVGRAAMFLLWLVLGAAWVVRPSRWVRR